MLTKEKRTGYPSIDKPWMKYYNESARNITIPQTTIYRFILENNKDYINDTALIYFGKQISYETMYHNIDKIADILTSKGLVKGDSILICSSQTPETVYLLLACSKIGICAVMVNPTLNNQQIEKIITESDAKLLFCMDKLYKVVKEIVSGVDRIECIMVPVVASLPSYVQTFMKLKNVFSKENYGNSTTWKVFLKSEISMRAEENTDINSSLVVVFSSGTTGEAKGIVHTNKSYISTSLEYRNNGYPFERGDKFLNHIPSFIASGLSFLLFAPLAFGVKVILEPMYSETVFVDDVIKYQPNIVTPTVSFWLAAVNNEKMKTVNLDFMKMPATGGEAVNEQDEQLLNAFLVEHGCKSKMYFGYGMSELNGTVVTTPVKEYTPGSTGIPLPSVVVAAFDVDTQQECTYGEYGEVMVQTPCQMKEYYKNPKRTRQFFWKDNGGRTWCRTGDIGYVNENGELFVRGRAVDSMLLRSGKRIYFFEIEDVVLEDSNVSQCKVICDESGQLQAHVILQDSGKTDNGFESIQRKIIDKLGEDVIIRHKVWDAFPLTPNGKVDKKAMSGS